MTEQGEHAVVGSKVRLALPFNHKAFRGAVSCLFPAHRGLQMCSHTSPVLGTARPWVCIRAASLSPCSNSPRMPLCCCPGDNAGAGRRRSAFSLSKSTTKRSQTEGAVSDAWEKRPGLTQTRRFRVRPSLSKHGWASLQPHPAALQGPEQHQGRAALAGVVHQDPQEGSRRKGWRCRAGHPACRSRRQCHG